jgi:hypothetical protein
VKPRFAVKPSGVGDGAFKIILYWSFVVGDILNIRVIAQTMDEEDVAKAWPGLCTLVWPQWMNTLKLQAMRFARLNGGRSSVERMFGQKKHGVMELAQSLTDIFNIGEIPVDIVSFAKEPAARVTAVHDRLVRALADWNTQEANLLSNQLETALDVAEKAIFMSPVCCNTLNVT